MPHDVGRGGVREVDELCAFLLENAFFREVLMDDDPNTTVLDVAGGNGILSRTLAEAGVSNLVVVDPKGLLPDAEARLRRPPFRKTLATPRVRRTSRT